MLDSLSVEGVCTTRNDVMTQCRFFFTAAGMLRWGCAMRMSMIEKEWKWEWERLWWNVVGDVGREERREVDNLHIESRF